MKWFFSDVLILNFKYYIVFTKIIVCHIITKGKIVKNNIQYVSERVATMKIDLISRESGFIYYVVMNNIKATFSKS